MGEQNGSQELLGNAQHPTHSQIDSISEIQIDSISEIQIDSISD